MKEKEIEIKLTEIHNKLGKDSRLCSSFTKSILTYFKKEYLTEDYDFVNNVNNDMCNIVNDYLSMEKYISFHYKLNEDDLSFITAMMINYLEGYVNE